MRAFVLRAVPAGRCRSAAAAEAVGVGCCSLGRATKCWVKWPEMSARLESTTESEVRARVSPPKLRRKIAQSQETERSESHRTHEGRPACPRHPSRAGSWALPDALAEPRPKLPGSSALLLPSERWPLRSEGDDLTGCLSLSTGNVGLFGFLLPQGLSFNITFPLIYMRTFPNSKLPIN